MTRMNWQGRRMTQGRGLAVAATIAAFGVLTSTATPTATAGLLVYEPFSYGASNITDLNGVTATGTGLSGNYGGTANVVRYEAAGLTYGLLATTGGTAYADASGEVRASLASAVTSAIIPTNGQTKTTWMSFLAKRASNSNTTDLQGIALDRSSTGNQMNSVRFNSAGTTINTRVGSQSNSATLSDSIDNSETVLVLAKLVLSLSGSNQTATITGYTFYNGTIPTSESALTGLVTSTQVSTSDRFPSFMSIISNFGDYRFDEVRVGLDDAGDSDFGGVLALVPEPSSLLLAGAGLLLLAGRGLGRHAAIRSSGRMEVLQSICSV